jgi:hypothetical protein
MTNKADSLSSRGTLIWSARPSVSVYYGIYGALALATIVVLVVAELFISRDMAGIFPSSMIFASILVPYPVELATILIVLVIYLAKVLSLAFLQIRNKYELYEDGLYVDSGIINLENTFIAPMAFSDARLIRTWELRLANRSNILVEANDGRKFLLQLIERGVDIQTMIRRILAHPTVRIEGNSSQPRPSNSQT